ncbi:MAG: hypothetical protein ABI809_11550, partial [Caldimonas sp.]
MDAPSTDRTPAGAGSSGFLAGLRQAFVAYARWLDSISWKRFVLLSILAMIASGILSELPPLSTKWGASPSAMPPMPPSFRKSAPKVSIDGADKQGRAYEINIDKSGVHIKRAPRGSASAARASDAAADEVPAVPDRDASAPPPARKSGRGEVHIKLPDNVDSDEIERAIEEAQAEIDAAVGEAPRTRRSADLSVGSHLPQFTFLLIVLSVVTKIMAA